MEYWSDGVMGFAILQDSITPLLRFRLAAAV
jgi:hypothetical protein